MSRQRARSASRHQHNCLPRQSSQSSHSAPECAAGFISGCLPCKSSYHHSNTMRVKSVSRQRAVSTPPPCSNFPSGCVLGEESHSNLTFQEPVTDAEHNFRQLFLPDTNDISDAESPLHLEERFIDLLCHGLLQMLVWSGNLLLIDLWDWDINDLLDNVWDWNTIRLIDV